MKNFPSLRIMIVDDEALIRWSLAETLADSGHQVQEADSARHALDQLAGDYRPDVVLLDLCLPDSDNLDLLRRIRAVSPASAVIMMTAFAAPDLADDAQRIGAYRVMNKPVELNRLVPLVLESYAARPVAVQGH